MESASTAALVVSIVSAGFTFGGLLWQLALYRLSGSRLNVQMVPVLIDSQGAIVHGHPAGWTRKPPPGFIKDLGQYSIDLAMVRVTNVGRTAVSTEEVQIDFGRPQFWRRGRRGAAGQPIPLRTGQVTNDQHRLEPGEAIRVYFDPWPVIAEARQRRSTSVTLRGSVRAVSRRATLSPRRYAWVITPDQERLQPDKKVSSELAAYHILWRSLVREDGFFEKVYMVWMQVQSQLNRGAPVQEVTAILEEHFGSGQSFTAMQIVDTYRAGQANAK